MMTHSDLFAMSFYPYGNIVFDDAVKPSFLDFAKAFHKPIAVSESGMLTRDVTLKSFALTLHGTEAQQTQFEQFLLGTAGRDGYAFVINFASTDFDKLVARLSPPMDDWANIWAYTGLQTSDRKPKPALSVWDRFLAIPVRE